MLGLALDQPRDEVRATLTEEPGIKISCGGPYGERVPTDPDKNVAGFAATRILALAETAVGVHLEVIKNIPPGSGLGSSAASSVAASVAVMNALKVALSEESLLEICGAAEGLAAGAAHLDNVAPALLGGFVGVMQTSPAKICRFEVPSDWRFAVILPHKEVKTAEARAVLPETVPMEDAISNLRHLTGLFHALHAADLESFASHLHDKLAIPYRAPLLPFFETAQRAALEAGAFALQVSGSGPALFAPCNTEESAARVCIAVSNALEADGIGSTTYTSKASSGALELGS